jgi:membrane protease subunit (stomatin/prohibitin family)
MNDAGSSFCHGCGASLAAQIHCPNCNSMNALGRAFCTRCGGSLEHAGWDSPPDPGAVVDGVWERGGDELIRRVDPEDARNFLGSRTVSVPAGTVGVVLVNGMVDRVLPPGERTSLSLFQRIANFFTQRERTAFYLVDQRPFPVPFVVRTRPNATGQSVKSQVLVTFLLPKGNRDALSLFIANVMRDRPSVSTGDLYNLLRPEVARVSQEVLERQSDDIDYAAAEAEIRRRLAESIGARYGLLVEATLAPLTTIASLNLQLGTGTAPKVRPCVTCRAEIPASMKFCDRCGEQQPTVVDAGGPVDASTPLFTADGQQVELDLVLRVQGQHDDFTPTNVAPAIVSAAAAHLRSIAYAQLTGPGGFAALEHALVPRVTDALQSLGMTLVSVAGVDARTKTGQWSLAARADLERATESLRLGLAWVEHRDNELDLEALTLTRVLREQQQRRDHRFADDAAALGDRERREDLANRQATMDHAKVQRDAALSSARLEAELADLRTRRDFGLEDLEKKRRLELELERLAEEQQLAKMRAMAELDREGQQLDHAHEMEKRAALRGLSPDEMIAMQAGELAKSDGGGAAWANALASRGDAERRHAEEQRQVYDKAMTSMAQVASTRAAPSHGAPVVAVANTPGAPATAVANACPSCGAGLRADAKFCNACGKPV